jgi:ABC-2 type transport system permease protein
MQTGGLLKDLTVRETVEYTGNLFAHSQPTGEVLAGPASAPLPTVGSASAQEESSSTVRPCSASLRMADQKFRLPSTFGLNRAYDGLREGHGNVSAFAMISLALYGAVIATSFGGAMVSMERAQGWSRQLRLTPLSPVAYVVIKVLTALVLGACSVAAVYSVGAITNKPSMSVGLWIATGVSVWIGSLLSFAGGLFIPVSQFAQGVQDVARWTPLYGLNQLVHTPLLGNGVDWTWVVNVLAWLIIFVSGAVWRMRSDTGRP